VPAKAARLEASSCSSACCVRTVAGSPLGIQSSWWADEGRQPRPSWARAKSGEVHRYHHHYSIGISTPQAVLLMPHQPEPATRGVEISCSSLKRANWWCARMGCTLRLRAPNAPNHMCISALHHPLGPCPFRAGCSTRSFAWCCFARAAACKPSSPPQRCHSCLFRPSRGAPASGSHKFMLSSSSCPPPCRHKQLLPLHQLWQQYMSTQLAQALPCTQAQAQPPVKAPQRHGKQRQQQQQQQQQLAPHAQAAVQLLLPHCDMHGSALHVLASPDPQVCHSCAWGGAAPHSVGEGRLLCLGRCRVASCGRRAHAPAVACCGSGAFETTHGMPDCLSDTEQVCQFATPAPLMLL